MEASSRSGGRPTTWMVIAGVCALAAVGFAIWAFTTRSELDDANATIGRQQEQLSAGRRTARAQEERLAAFGRRERAAYRRVRGRLVREEADAADLRKRVKSEASQLQQARTDVSNAQAQDEKEAARLRQESARARLAIACSASAVDALQRFLDSASAREGARKAVAQLRATQQECQTAANER
jgi:hypothetical protein